MLPSSAIIKRSPIIIKPDPARTVIRPFGPSDPSRFAMADRPRALRIADRVLNLSASAVQEQLAGLMSALSGRHRDVPAILDRRYAELQGIFAEQEIDADQAHLIAAYMLEEYSFEAAALFNPSMVPHRDQAGTPEGATRFVMSLRGIGEGHVSSVTFRTGTWSRTQGFAIDPVSPISIAPKIRMMDDDGSDVIATIDCGGSQSLSETVLFPILPSQARGIEDMRLVRFTDDDGSIRYLGTYTAFNGAEVRQQLLETEDFSAFTMYRVTGEVADAKGLAIFPRRIGGRYHALSRQDNENLWLMTSDSPCHWSEGHRLLAPENTWEFVQLGNCGSPHEIEEGWLVLTHGVGTVRNYAVGACLLDRDDPSRVLARTTRPLLQPSPDDRDGYVPNVVYSCGAMLCGRTLVLPYGVADNFTTFATLDIDALLASMAPV
jgi:predicted GH43/DUF377 family glycosyl hydrolase